MKCKKQSLVDAVWFCAAFILIVGVGVLFLNYQQKQTNDDERFMEAVASLGTGVVEIGEITADPVYYRSELLSHCRNLQDSIITFSVLYQNEWIPCGKILAMIYTESRFDTAAVSSVGCIGLMQIHPQTAKLTGYDFRDSLYSPEYNIRTGTAVMKLYCEHYGGYMPGLNAYTTGGRSMGFAWKYERILNERARRWVWL